MNRLLTALGIALLAWLGATAGLHAQVGPSPHARVSLVAAERTVAPGGRIWVAVVLDQESGWHSYWRNPGDAGEPTTLAWTLPTGWRAGPIVWPAPHRLPLGPIMNYGYEGKAVLPVQLDVPASARAGAPAQLAVKVDYLICADVCVPGEATATLDLPVAAGPAARDPAGAALIDAALAATPQPGRVKAVFQRQGANLRLAVDGAPLAGAAAREAYFFPYDATLIDQPRPQAIERGPRGLTFTLAPPPTTGAATPAPPPTHLAGAVVVDGKAFDIDARPGALPADAAGLGPPAAAGAATATQGADVGLLLSLAYAFVGGLILNLMPCVFPILSMKAAALAGHGGAHGAARSQALAFLGGVMLCFLGLAGALLAARAAGSAVGWGFQLQSPTLVALLALVMLAAALDLSGLYEIGTSLQGLGSGLAARGGLVGAFATGVLAVVVAAPCTAPFMGPALGFALTQAPVAALSVFAALGLGFAAPFVVVALSPAIIRRLPRPGAWMDGFRKTMAFPMYGAAAWLAWVLARQSGADALARLLAAAIVLAFAAWLFGVAQRRAASGGKALLPAGVALGALVAAGVVAAAPAGRAALEAQPWSPEAVQKAQAAGHPVLVNFTAAWCVTCQVNEKVAFSSSRVAQAFRRAGAVYLVGDWTSRDAAIGSALSAQGRAGVPLYLVYGARGGSPKVLPQLLTPEAVAQALDQARG